MSLLSHETVPEDRMNDRHFCHHINFSVRGSTLRVFWAKPYGFESQALCSLLFVQFQSISLGPFPLSKMGQ